MRGNTRTTISATVKHLLVDTGMKKSQLAVNLGVSSAYMPRKISEGRWTVDELDTLAEIFDVQPEDFVRGYSALMKEKNE